MLTDDEIRALLEGCEGVTPGPWQRQYMPTKFTNYVRSNAAFVADSIGENLDAAHIARCDPGTIAELCTRLLSAEARVKGLERAARNIKPYLVWTIGLESPGYHPTMPSAVNAFLAALQEQSK
jgi:hypothetical protein